MFDPSKLDLDLDNLKKKNIPVPKEAIKKALKKVEASEKISTDILPYLQPNYTKSKINYWSRSSRNKSGTRR